ncbi:hypothetical protein QR680_004340 [Steinernema hermaphroditum]|uniref:Transthyretin-like family protein n=1 Tax=Steinernema hermaphroditum TaxID=289476 RepID=A0AA39HNF3_9BILA|nr:hypothetical protein QR680_004340 [Steinernema hermaphroditum]
MKSLLVLLVAFASVCYGYKQNITVTGQVICQMHTLANARVELREHDTFSRDDSLAVIHSNKEGHFKLFGEHDEITQIRPYLRILHNCNVPKSETKCLRQTEFDISPEKVGGTFDIGHVNVYLQLQRESLVCH